MFALLQGYQIIEKQFLDTKIDSSLEINNKYVVLLSLLPLLVVLVPILTIIYVLERPSRKLT